VKETIKAFVDLGTIEQLVVYFSVDASRVATLRARGDSWSQIQAELGVSKGTAQRVFAALPKIV